MPLGNKQIPDLISVPPINPNQVSTNNNYYVCSGTFFYECM